MKNYPNNLTNNLSSHRTFINIIKSLPSLWPDGPTKEKLSLSKVQVVTGLIILTLLLTQKILNLRHLPNYLLNYLLKFLIVTVGYQLLGKKMISTDKLNTCHQNIQTIKSSQTLDQELISKERVLKPFWTNASTEMSKKLWLPLKIDSVDSGLNSLNGFFQNIKSDSWFSIQKFQTRKKNLPLIYYQSLTSFLQELMDEENINLEKIKKTKNQKQKTPSKKNSKKKKDYVGVLITRKIKVKLTPFQFMTIKQWLGICRKIYNSALESFNKKETSYDDLRDKFALSTGEFLKQPENDYALKCPKEIREEMINKLRISIDTNFRLLSEGKIKKFHIKFKSRKEYKQSLPIPKSGFSKIKFNNFFNIYPTKLKDKKNKAKFQNCIEIKRSSENVGLPTDYVMSNLVLKNNQSWMSLTKDTKMSESDFDNQEIYNICSLDPGVRTFQTVYSPDGSSYKIGHQDAGRIIRMGHYLSKLQSKIDICKNNACKNDSKNDDKKDQPSYRLFRYQRAYHKLSDKIRNSIDELHNKTINFLIRRYNVIVIPDTNLKNMVSKKARKINKETVRKLLTFSHYRFRERLIMKSKIQKGLKVYTLGEEYTTKTCGKCGLLNNKVGSKKEFMCKQCGICLDRDLNGARNILIKYFTEREKSEKSEKRVVLKNNVAS